ncbi:multidrug effflux MFS transporter [Flammeovirga sp. MY04]|uniref:MFS transporter n=1 Tax=Flammeovirga sp. MY04 TaxID=1191459 RepID=UPI0008063B14|nr:MFS transporter [Flammeovirga sp. MY04]ANQ50453.1 multidrug effflux MFS transporter [Flammeovirga sp. MY04]
MNKKLHAFIMYLTVPLAAVTVDIVVTSLPSIKEVLGVDTHLAQYVFTFGVLGFGIGQIFSGFVTDAYNRKTVLISSISMLITLLIGAVFTSNIHFLIFLRFLQGLAISFIAVASRAVVRDIHTDEEYKNAVNYITIGFALALTVSPMVGSLILTMFSYKAVFVFLIIYSTLMLVMIFFSKETNNNKKPLNRKNAFHDLKILFQDMVFIRSLIMCGCFYTIVPIFDTLGSFYVTDVFDYTPIEFGWAEIILAVAWLSGNIFNRFLSTIDLHKKTMTSFIIGFTGCIIGFLFYQSQGESDIVVIGVMCIIVFVAAILFPLHLGTALVKHGQRAGVANAIIFSGCWMITSFISNTATFLDPHTALSIYLLIVFVLAIALSSYLLGKRKLG